MKSEAQQSRDADLLLARQFGQAFVREADSQRVRADFNRVFKEDTEALQQYEIGVVEEDQRRLALGMTPEQYHAHYANKLNPQPAKRRSNASI